MNILYVLNATPLAGGGSKSFLGMLEEVRKHHNVLVVAPDDKDMVPYLRSLGIEVRVIKYIFNIRPITEFFKDYLLFLPRLIKRKIVNRLATRKLEGIAREFNADIIHTNASVNEIGFNAARHLGLPHILHIREYPEAMGLHVYGLDKILHSKDSNNIFITKDLAKFFNCDKSENSVVIYNPVVDSENMMPPSYDKTYILYAGRVDTTKGIPDLIDGYILYAKRNPENSLPLKIAGSISSEHQQATKKKAEKKLSDEGLSHKVEWLGERSDIKQLMADARVVVVPSLFEGFGRILPESMAAGTIVIGRNTGGTQEQLDNGLLETGREIGLRFTNNEELAEALNKAVNLSDEEYERMVKDSQYTICKLYSKSESTKKVLKAYENLESNNKIGI